MKIIGLEVPGFSLFINKSEHHVYSLLNGRRKVTDDIADYLSKKLGVTLPELFNLEREVPEWIRNADSLTEFRKEYPNPEYYTERKEESSFSHFLKNELLASNAFGEPRYVWEINKICNELNRTVDSDTLSKHLKYLVAKNMLQSKKAPIKLRRGGYGKREVDVFFTGAPATEAGEQAGKEG